MYDGEGGEEGGQQAQRSAGHSTAITGHVLNVLTEQPKKWTEYQKTSCQECQYHLSDQVR